MSSIANGASNSQGASTHNGAVSQTKKPAVPKRVGL